MQIKKVNSIIGSSFRDPSGTVFLQDSIFYRHISNSYKENYQQLMKSGLYKKLVNLNLLIPHEEVRANFSGVFKTIRPVQIPFISYPYEWCFSQFKEAALRTLEIQIHALDYGMILKDASAYNIQFHKGKAIFIDTLSFENYQPGQPWVAYRQFCMHFLAPLLLMSRRNIHLNKMLQLFIEGIPLDLTASLLPISSLLKPSIFAHIYLHSKAQSYFANKQIKVNKIPLSKPALMGLMENLKKMVEDINLTSKTTEWTNYYQNNSYAESFRTKAKIVSGFVEETHPKMVWDLGSNTGIFSHKLASEGIMTISFDYDPYVVELNYRQCNKKKLKNCLPLVIDLANPSPDIGWAGQEIMSLKERGPADTVLALALIHHLTIGRNVPFEKVADFLSKITRNLIIEFVPKEDSQTQKLLSGRKDVFINYRKELFETSFSRYFVIKQRSNIKGSLRDIYLMKSKFI